MINNSEIFERLEKININQEERDINQKMSEIMTVLQNPIQMNCKFSIGRIDIREDIY